MPNKANKNNNNAAVPTLAEYIAQQIATKRAAALDKSRNRTSVRIPMIPNKRPIDVWEGLLNNDIKYAEEALSRAIAEGNKKLAALKQEELDSYLKEKDVGYPKLVPGANCMYNAGDCYDLNIPGNKTFVAKHKELGFKKAPKGSMEPGDIVQDVKGGTPIHAMIYDSKDTEGNLLFNYARGNGYADLENGYVKQGKYPLPIKDYDVYKYVGTPTDSTQWINEYKQQYGDGMRCGGRRKAQLGLDIREGGVAIPIAPNMYYMNGRSHDEGGIAIGPNNKNGLEVEGGEVVKVGKNDVKVFSSVPLLRGASPAELVMGGANPNKVFKAQEDFKDRNRINDDGTTYEMGGDKVIHINNLPSSFRGQLRNGRYVKIGVPPVTSKAKSWNTTFKDHINSLNVEMKDFIMDGINYGKKLLPKPLKKYYSRAINILNSPGVQDINNSAQKITQVTSMFDEKKAGGIYIKPSKRGTFTAAATKHGMGVQEFASKVLANKEDYSPAMVKKANFARNASHWKKEYGGNMLYTINGNVKNGLSLRPKAELGKEKKYKHNKIDGYGDSVETDGKFYRYDSDSGLYLLEDKETVNTNLSKTVYGASSVRHIAYDRQGNRYQRRSDGTLIRVSPKKDDYATSKELEEVVITPEKPKKVENVSITGEKVENGVKKTNTPSIEGKTSVSSYRTGPNAHAIPDFVGKEPVKVEEAKPVTTNKITVNNKKVTTTNSAPASTVEQPAVVRRDEYYSSPRVEGPATPVDETYAARQARGTQAVTEYKTDTNNTDNTKNNNTKGKWIGQYKTTNIGDWIGLGSNLLGSILSYGLTNSAINKTPMAARPAIMQAAKLKTTYNVEPQLSEIREAEQMNRAAVRRNTASSNTSLAREQRLLNEARGARGTLYGQKENIETQLINQDRLNRQQVGAQNTALYNDYLNRVVGTKQAQNQYRISNVNNLLSGLTGSVNNILGTIESRRATNNTLRAIAAANPNVDARLIGGFDYYIDPVTKKKYNKNQQYVRTING